MNRDNNILFAFFAAIIFCSCSNNGTKITCEKQLLNSYVFKNDSVIDSLHIYGDMSYRHIMYNKNNDLFLNDTGTWKFEEGRKLVLANYRFEERNKRNLKVDFNPYINDEFVFIDLSISGSDFYKSIFKVNNNICTGGNGTK
jgi:hypothetical protein